MMDFIEIEGADFAESEAVEAIDSIEKIDPATTYNEFFNSFLIKNRPCVFSTETTEDWKSVRTWCSETGPNFEFLDKSFGNSLAPVADCSYDIQNNRCMEEMTLNHFIEYWIGLKKCNHFEKKKLLYLKDWHFVKNHPEEKIYEVPKFFASDWLNEYYTSHSELQDDYMFVYMGPIGTWTPFHEDVLKSNSWSANVCGKKRWLLYPPGQENQFRDIYGNLFNDVNNSDCLQNKRQFKNYDPEHLKGFEIIQNAGEVIFVPSGWHHQVWNLEDTISINHNSINGSNIHVLYEFLRKRFEEVEKEIADCKDMENYAQHCQVMLKASWGMDFAQFFELLEFITKKRLSYLNEKIPVISFGKWQLGLNHCLFDLRAIKRIFVSVTKDVQENFFYSSEQVYSLLAKIDSAL